MAGFDESGGPLSVQRAVPSAVRAAAPRRADKALALGLSVAVVLLLHAALLQGVDWRPDLQAGRRMAAPALQVRTVVPERPLSFSDKPAQSPSESESIRPALPYTTSKSAPSGGGAEAAATARPRAAAHTMRPDAPDRSPKAATTVLSPALPSARPDAEALDSFAAPHAAHSAEDEPVPQMSAPSSPAMPTAEPSVQRDAATGDSDRELPVYRTQVPPVMTMRYALRRGAEAGQAELSWSPQGERYEVRLALSLGGKAPSVQVSQGAFDEAGVAPTRMTDQRQGASMAAVNFQRDKGLITFSGPAAQFPLLMGAQDRLSWMVQLAAVVSAEPHRLEEGGKVVIHVSGARGDSQVWVFRSQGLQALDTPAGQVQAVRFLRNASGPYDTHVGVWLDPQRHHLPAKLTMHQGREDQALEFLLLSGGTAP